MKKFHSLAAGITAACATLAMVLSGSMAAQAATFGSQTYTKTYAGSVALKHWKSYSLSDSRGVSHCAVKAKNALACVGHDTLGSDGQRTSLLVTGSVTVPEKVRAQLAKGHKVQVRVVQTISGLGKYEYGRWEVIVVGGNPMNNFGRDFLGNGSHSTAQPWIKVHKNAKTITLEERLDSNTSLTFKSFKVIYKY